MAVSFDWEPRTGEEPWLRAYIPCCPVMDLDHGDDEEDDEDSSSEQQARAALGPQVVKLRGLSRLLLRGGPARGQAVVALRPIKDEELFQVCDELSKA